MQQSKFATALAAMENQIADLPGPMPGWGFGFGGPLGLKPHVVPSAMDGTFLSLPALSNAGPRADGDDNDDHGVALLA